jgi:apolipoprotein N-acyltransferase
VTLKHMFAINAFISAVFGLGLILAPAAVGALYSQHLDPDGVANTRMWGTAIFGYALMTWFCRNAEDSETRRRMVLALFSYFTIGFAACVFNFWTEPQPLIAWTTPLLYLLLALGYGCFHFIHYHRSRDVMSLMNVPH